MTMKTLRMALALAAIPVLALAAPAEAKHAAKKAAPSASVALKSAVASVKILGDSTMHKWEANATALTISGEAKDGDLLTVIKAGALSKLELVIGVDGLESTESKSMDKNMHKAMESEQAPEIKFSLKSYTVDGDAVLAKGSLSIHNVAKDVELKGVLAAKDGAVTVKGSYGLLMSDYGVKPPVMMLGTVKVKDAVTIAYEFNLAK